MLHRMFHRVFHQMCLGTRRRLLHRMFDRMFHRGLHRMFLEQGRCCAAAVRAGTFRYCGQHTTSTSAETTKVLWPRKEIRPRAQLRRVRAHARTHARTQDQQGLEAACRRLPPRLQAARAGIAPRHMPVPREGPPRTRHFRRCLSSVGLSGVGPKRRRRHDISGTA